MALKCHRIWIIYVIGLSILSLLCINITSLPTRMKNLGTLSSIWYLGLSLGFLYSSWQFLTNKFRKPLQFIINCFFKPVGSSSNQQERLETFYKDQTDVYDDTRHSLLRGRSTMLKLCAAQLQQTNSDQPRIWIDLGGGTGWNIERMQSYLPLNYFDFIYLIDLTPSLCKVAQARFEKLGWHHVKVICADAETFQLPGITKHEISLITLSYSLSMMDNFYGVVDRISSLLSPTGLLGVADFYISGRVIPSFAQTGGILNRKCHFFTRLFWQIWFEFDHITLHPSRRDYLEYKFSTVKSFSGRNHFIMPYLIQIPYYVWLGGPKSFTSLTEHRLTYDPTLPCHTQFNNYIYAFTWEDPREDLRVLNLQPDDSMLVITSAGDNVLDYLCHSNLSNLHCVDLNPHQNHLLELKISCIKGLNYSDVWKLFGEGHHPKFDELLDTKLSPYLSSHAYQFWKSNTNRFTKTTFFKTGWSGLAMNLVGLLFKLTGVASKVDILCRSKTIQEQFQVYTNYLRPRFLNRYFLSLLDNPVFLWKATGVPISQWKMILDEGSFYQYMSDTLDPIFKHSLLRDDQYFYQLCLMFRYTPDACPNYVTESGFNRLQSNLQSIKLHTASITDVLRELPPNYLTKCVLMDHMDWFDLETAREEIQLLYRTLKPQGQILWRSSSRHPWYNQLFIESGFKVTPISIRIPGSLQPLDRVNMYASFYQAIKI